MKKQLNCFYLGEDNSHCSSCWSSSDENLTVLVTTMTSEEVKNKFEIFAYDRLMMEESYEPQVFLRWLNNYMEENTEYSNDISMVMGLSGTCCSPYLTGKSCGAEWDIEALIKPIEILGEDNWNEIKDSWTKNKNERLKREEDRRKAESEKKRIEEEKRKNELKAEQEKQEYKQFLKLKKKYEHNKKLKE